MSKIRPIPATMDWPAAETFGDVIAMAAARYADKIAFRDERRAVSFAMFASEVDRVAAALIERGLRPGDRVAILSQNRIEAAVLLGLCRAGLVPTPLNWRLADADIARLLQNCRPAALFVEDRFIPALGALRAQLGWEGVWVVLGDPAAGWLSYEHLAAGAPAAAAPPRLRSDDPCCLIYTSGTTGTPKGVLVTHRGAVGNCRDVAREAIGFRFDDVTLAVMPLFHIGGIWCYLFPSFAAGCTTVIRARFDPDDVVAVLRREAVTNIHIVPTMLADLLARPAMVSAAARLRLIVYAASSMPVELLRRAMQELRGCRFAQSYGSTEAGCITALGPEEHERASSDPAQARLLRSCGRPVGDTELRIEAQQPQAPEAIGEILVRSSKVMAGYWQQPEATAERIQNGWLRTGDIGHRDAQGYLYIVDRKNDMVISGGENIFPFEVEEVLCRHPGVSEAAVFGVPHPRWVEKLVAAVVVRPGARITPEELIAHARRHLAGYKTPKAVVLLPALPRSAVGKILRRQLRTEYAGRI